MFTVKSGEEFVADVRALDERLKNIRLSGVEVSKRDYSVTYNFICDTTVDDDLKEKIRLEAEKITDKIFDSVRVKVFKIVSNPELINSEIYKYLTQNFTSISLFLKPTDIFSVNNGNSVKYTLKLTSDGVEYMKRNDGLKKLSLYLEKKFCSDFFGETVQKESEETVDLMQEEVFYSELKKVQLRTVKVEDVVVIDDISMGSTALYIEDFTSGNAVISGKITEITEKVTKNGKPFFRLYIDDTTGRTGGCYFSKKATYNKIRELAVGDAIIARANIGEYNGAPSLTFDKINRCTFPKDFVKQDRFKNTAPKNYKTVFPEPASTIRVNSVFTDESLPEEVLSKEYVVFDLETTGLDPSNNGIIDIGAVKIKNGKITEQFASLIKPDYPITEEITSLTGISPDMVKDSPKISTVLPDFMKFIENTTLVGHNVDFDLKFVKRFAFADEYEVNNPSEDTMTLARRLVPTLKRFDLQTLSDHFEIVFHHHRALADAYATAEAFLKLKNLDK